MVSGMVDMLWVEYKVAKQIFQGHKIQTARRRIKGWRAHGMATRTRPYNRCELKKTGTKTPC